MSETNSKSTYSRSHRRGRVGAWLAFAAMLTLIAGACASNDDSSESAKQGEVESSSQTTSGGAEGEGSLAGDAPSVAMRAIETSTGTVEVPVEPTNIIALDEYAALDLLAVDVEPSTVFGTYQSEVGASVLAEKGIDVVPGTFGSYNYEAIAELAPDLIVLTAEGGVEELIAPLHQVAPVVIIPYDAPWREILAFTAELTGKHDRAAAVQAALESRIEPFHAAAAAEEPSIGILANTPGFGIFSMSELSPLSGVLSELGYDRPEIEQGPSEMGSAIMTSEELIGDHDADIVAVLSGAYYDASFIEDLEVFKALPAVKDGRSVVVDGDVWLGTFPFAVSWILDDLEALNAGEGQDGIGVLDDAPERWAAFEALTR